ncbi:MAG TPA: biopolymer transporter ExbD [bacterium]|nr:biopolymer transporter ExbD [bacterium]
MKPPPNLQIWPLAAVALVLVLIMMVISPLVVSLNSTPVDLPQTHSSERKVESARTITYTADGRLLVDDKPLADLQALADSVSVSVQKDPYVLVVVRADTTINSWKVLDILSTARRAGAQRIVCATKKFREGY